MQKHDFDFIVIGSGFGGSVSAMRLAEKGYRVAVLEEGKRWKNSDFPPTNWHLRKFLWLPTFLCHGFFRMTLLKDIFILGGSGVGGGSLVYANTLLIPPDKTWDHSGWAHLSDWKSEMPAFYETAKRMLGATPTPFETRADRLVKAYAETIGQGDSYSPTTVGVFFGKPGEEGKRVPDPYFDGEGPDRAGCTRCGGCMVGCQLNAKNTLDKNYLFFAEKHGAEVIPELRATNIQSIGDGGSGGYEVTVETSTSLFSKRRRTITAKGVIVSAGVLGTHTLLDSSRSTGGLAQLSPRLGDFVRTNNESILGVQGSIKDDYTDGIAITSQIDLDEHTHMEPVRYPKGSNALFMFSTLLTDGGGKVPRIFKWLATIVRHPIHFMLSMRPWKWARRSVILLVMQTLDSHIKLRRKRRWFWPFRRGITSVNENRQRIPTYIPAGNKAARWIAKEIGGIPMSTVTEVTMDIPMTAHILGGCAMGENAEMGVIDTNNQVWGYQNLFVIDGSMIGANLGVNPSLTITALAERAMSKIPTKTSVSEDSA